MCFIFALGKFNSKVLIKIIILNFIVELYYEGPQVKAHLQNVYI